MNNSCFEIRNTPKGKALFATKNIKKDFKISDFEKTFVTKPSNKTLRIDENIHQQSKNPNSPENFINHSCAPSAYIDWTNLSLRAIQPILKGEEITYNYFTSDWDNEDVFECKCGSIYCYKYINGFKNLSLDRKKKIKKFLSPFLKRKFEEQLKKK